MTEKFARKQIETYTKESICGLKELLDLLRDKDANLVDVEFKINRVTDEIAKLKTTLENCDEY